MADPVRLLDGKAAQGSHAFILLIPESHLKFEKPIEHNASLRVLEILDKFVEAVVQGHLVVQDVSKEFP